MAEIKLQNSHFVALVDDDDVERILAFSKKWGLDYSGYAVCSIYDASTKKSKKIGMHRVVNNTPQGLVTDHINFRKLDNRKSNLRSVTHSQNVRHQKIPLDKTRFQTKLKASFCKKRHRAFSQSNPCWNCGCALKERTTRLIGSSEKSSTGLCVKCMKKSRITCPTCNMENLCLHSPKHKCFKYISDSSWRTLVLSAVFIEEPNDKNLS